MVMWSGQEVSAVYLYSWAQNQVLISVKLAATLKQTVIGFLMCRGVTSQFGGLMGQQMVWDSHIERREKDRNDFK